MTAGAATSPLPGDGVIYRVKSDGTAWEAILHFGGSVGPDRGSLPSGGFLDDGAGFIWGTTWGGGQSNLGTVFKIDLATHGHSTIVDFSGNGAANRGANPRSRLTLTSDGTLWGTTRSGGASDLGTVFKLDKVSGLLTSVASFSGSSGTTRGAYPSGPLVSDGGDYFWGLTEGAPAMGHGDGTVFKIHKDTLELTTVVEFSGDAGANKGSGPNGALHRDGDGNWWGVTTAGGTAFAGTVFKIGGASGIKTTVMEFTGQSGARRGAKPTGGLTPDGAGFLWGVTGAGGSYDLGTVFNINPTTGAFTSVVSFTGKSGAELGSTPGCQLLTTPGGLLWGTTSYGGVIDAGTVFQINPATNAHTSIVDFTPQGISPHHALFQDETGALWGATALGGVDNRGTLFHLDWESGRMITDVQFGGGAIGRKGALPNGNLIRDGAGRLWGTTRKGGAGDWGTIFVFDPGTRELSTPVEFTSSGPQYLGAEPEAGLLAASDGQYWGTTRLGGARNSGTIFKIDPQTRSHTTVAQLGATVGMPSLPMATLIDDGHGFLWGSGRAGAGSYGGIFKISIATGEVTKVIGFTESGAVPGSTPYADLLAWGTDALYGTSSQGGGGGAGTVFKLDRTSGTLTSLGYFYANFDFSGNPIAHRGSTPLTALVADGTGFLWGTTSLSGTNAANGNNGMIFKINAATGSYSPIMDFTGNGAKPHSGSSPRGPLLKSARDGNFYGTTSSGGPLRGGTLYRIRFGPTPHTLSPSSMAATSVTLKGLVNPNGDGETSVSFEYGVDAKLSGATTVVAGIVANGSLPSEVSADVTALTPDTTYFCRAIAVNSGNPIAQKGAILSFATPSLPPLDSWRLTHFETSQNNGDAADAADPDGDQVPNLVEFAFGLLPRDPTSSLLPAWEVTAEGYTVTFSPPAGVQGVTYGAEWTTSLSDGEWTALPDTGVPPFHQFVVPLVGRRELFVRFRCSTP